MPIRLNCKCGKTLTLKDEMAGKTVRCPGCKSALKVPSGGGASQAKASAPAKKAPTAKPTTQPSTPVPPTAVSSLFDEEGIAHLKGPVCPSCATEMRPGTVMCMNCGFNVETGTRVQAHTEAKVAASEFNNKELDTAAAHLARDAKTQKQVSGEGPPLWALSTILLCLIGLSVVGVFVSNAFLGDGDLPSGENVSPIPFLTLLFIMMFLGFMGIIFQVRIAVHGFRESMGKGFCCLLVPFYVLYYGFKHDETKADTKALLKLMIIAVVINICGNALLSSLGLI